jgi:hypothetical protein
MGGLSDGPEAGADQFVVGARVNHYELGNWKPGLLAVNILVATLKIFIHE